jgi:hypothetical protein
MVGSTMGERVGGHADGAIIAMTPHRRQSGGG